VQFCNSRYEIIWLTSSTVVRENKHKCWENDSSIS